MVAMSCDAMRKAEKPTQPTAPPGSVPPRRSCQCGAHDRLDGGGSDRLGGVQIVFGFHVSKKRVEFVTGLLRQLIEPLGP